MVIYTETVRMLLLKQKQLYRLFCLKKQNKWIRILGKIRDQKQSYIVDGIDKKKNGFVFLTPKATIWPQWIL